MNRLTLIMLLIISSISWAGDKPYGIDKSVSLPDDVCDRSECWATYFGASSKIYLEGGLCMDDPMRIIPINGKRPDGSPSYGYSQFSKICEIDERDEKLFDRPPISFSCKADGNLVISGATYAKTKNYVVKRKENKQQVIVDSRAYIYQCIKGCISAPDKIAYFLHDCG
jgi:hypothetical protein